MDDSLGTWLGEECWQCLLILNQQPGCPQDWCPLGARHGVPILSRSSWCPASLRCCCATSAQWCSIAVNTGSAGELRGPERQALPGIAAPELVGVFRQGCVSQISAAVLVPQWWRLLCSRSPCSVRVSTTVQAARVLAAC